MRILIAPNAFKNSLDATAAAQAISDGLGASALTCECDCFPVADGGDGTAALIVARCGGRWVDAEVSDPLGRKVPSRFGLIDDGKTAVIGMADASGLQLISAAERNPLITSSYGTGELILRALDHQVRRILIGVGGSATVDGAAGILTALGVQFLNDKGESLQPNPRALASLHDIDASGIDPRIAHCEIVVLCDVTNPLLGANGAAAIFGPQKGAGADSVRLLELFLSNFSMLTANHTGRKISDVVSGGAAGGVAAGLLAYCDARLEDGIGYYLSITGFESALQKADLVITAEGSLDAQTLQGKGPFGVASMAKRLGVPVIGLAGSIPLADVEPLRQYFKGLLAIGNAICSLEEAIINTRSNLQRTATEIGNLLSLRIPAQR